MRGGRRGAPREERTGPNQRVASQNHGVLQTAVDRHAAAEQSARALVAVELSVPAAVRLRADVRPRFQPHRQQGQRGYHVGLSAGAEAPHAAAAQV